MESPSGEVWTTRKDPRIWIMGMSFTVGRPATQGSGPAAEREGRQPCAIAQSARTVERQAVRNRPTSPAGREGTALLEAGAGLDAHDGPFGELPQRGGADVGAGAPDPGSDVVDEVLHAGPAGVEEHPGGRDAFLEEPFPGSVERAVGRGARGHGTRRRHAVALLVGPALLVEQHVAGALVR